MSKRFNKIYIEITNRCNLSCSFCSLDARHKKDMSIKEFSLVINKIKDYTDLVYLHVKGEPLLHSKLDEILSICDENNIKVCLTTNGTLIEEKKDILIKHPIKQINISLHSENHMKDYFEKVFNTVDELSKKIIIIYRIWVLPSLDLDKISTGIVDKINNHYSLSKDLINKIMKDKNIKIKDHIYIDKDYEFEWPRIRNNKRTMGTCLGTKSHIAILSSGIVTPCCLDSQGIVNLGNIFNENLNDIINKPLFCEINGGFKMNKIVNELCQSCTYRLRFDKKK